MIHNAEEIQKLEHQFRMEEAKLQAILVEKSNLEQEEGEIRCRLQRIENDKFRLLTGRNV